MVEERQKIDPHANIIVRPLGIVETILKVLGFGPGFGFGLGPGLGSGLGPGFGPGFCLGLRLGQVFNRSGQWGYQRQNKEEHKEAEEVKHWRAG